jgi:hypothetical protein
MKTDESWSWKFTWIKAQHGPHWKAMGFALKNLWLAARGCYLTITTSCPM